MAKDPVVESHIAQSKAKIEKTAPQTVKTERHIDRKQRALERSRGSSKVSATRSNSSS